MLATVFDFKPGPTRVGCKGQANMSVIEQRFGRIALEIAARWKHDDIDAYLDSLLLDDRGNRQGFPMEVLENLMFLSSLRWQLQHPHHVRVDETLVDQFSFNPMSRLDTRYYEPERAWLPA